MLSDAQQGSTAVQLMPVVELAHPDATAACREGPGREESTTRAVQRQAFDRMMLG